MPVRVRVAVVAALVFAMRTVGCASFDSGGLPSGSPDSGPAADASGAAEGGGGDAGSPAPDDAGTDPYRDAVLVDLPVAYWRLGERDGAIAKDESGHGLHALYTPTCELGAPGVLLGSTNTALRVSPPCRVEVPAAVDLTSATRFTLEAWSIPKVIDGKNRKIFDNNWTSATTGYQAVGLYYNADVGLRFERFVDGDSKHLDVPVAAQQLHHVVATYDGATLQVYLDGAPVRTEPDSRRMSLSGRGLMFLGSSGDHQDDLDGLVDEAAVYDHALPADRIAAHWSIGHGAR